MNKKRKFGLSLNESKGFSLVEVLLSMAVLMVILGGVTSLAVGTIKNSRTNKLELEAYGQAQEQLEVVKQIRNSNLIDLDPSTDWKNGLMGSNQHIIRNGEDWRITTGEESLNSPTSGTIFTRWLDFSMVSDPAIDSSQDILSVKSVVQWNQQNQIRRIELSTYLTDWMWGYE